MPYLPTLVRFQNWNKMYPWQLSKIGTKCILYSCANFGSVLPLLVQTSFYHYWSKPVSTITGANQFLPLLVRTGFYHYWCRPVSTIIGFIQNWHIRFCHGWYTRVPFLPILAKNALPVVYSDAHAISTNFGLIFQNWHKMHSLFYRVTHIPFLPI